MDNKDKAVKLAQQIANQQQDNSCCSAKSSCSYISQNPFLSLGIAVVSGFLLSRVLSGR
ncbi:hypothetical protein [Crenothrix polyspora]|uniref:DUF883 domain-containing protein n=1 Tax=Crenothrix polyspora TaxID=360316 RepID=A0A1R4HAG8_9GAMM|nr:hypothetical protein [Crenothrix polyspora]SJM93213.1 conserved hypothetical protein [Crenothrix polyspora]